MKKKMRTVLLVLLMMGILQTLPVLFLKNPNMKSLEVDHFTLYYGKDHKEDALLVADLLEAQYDELVQVLGPSGEEKTEVFLYDHQWQLHLRKGGLITLLLPLDWYIGDNRGEKVLLLTPSGKNSVHGKEEILGAAIHEFIHSLNHTNNPSLSYFLDNGLATYYAKQGPYHGFLQDTPLPSYDLFHEENQMKFGTNNGYPYSYLFVEYLKSRYSNEEILAYRNEASPRVVFDLQEKELFDRWLDWLEERRKNEA